MKRFVFRLDSILKMRAREEDAAREILERFLGAQRRAERDLEAGNLQLERCEQALGSQRAGKSSVYEHLIHLHAAGLQREHCGRLATLLASAVKETEAQRRVFQTARRKHQAVLRIQERHARAHAAALQRHEENEVSDFINSRHAPAESSARA